MADRRLYSCFLPFSVGDWLSYLRVYPAERARARPRGRWGRGRGREGAVGSRWFSPVVSEKQRDGNGRWQLESEIEGCSANSPNVLLVHVQSLTGWLLQETLEAASARSYVG